MTNHLKVKDFYLEDYEGTIFPMETCKFMVENASKELTDYIVKVANDREKAYCFLPQETVYASKTKHHLRRTIKLDPVAEFYMYQMAYKTKTIFRKSNNENRRNYGYRFANGSMIPIHESYKEFIADVEAAKLKYEYFIKFDISAYFNSIYHHDLTNWFSSQRTTQADVNLLGQFMREINTGFSIDFMPHGLYPSKMLGNHFLSYIDHSELIKCELMTRFMDDFVLFSNSKDVLIKDFQTIQKALGQKSLNINTNKTVLFHEEHVSIDKEIDSVKSQIFKKVHIGSGSGMDYEEYEEIVRELTKEEIEYLINLIANDYATDHEATLILDCICEHTADFQSYVTDFIYKFPHLSKKIFHKCENNISDFNELSNSIIKLLQEAPSLNEYQLFWLAKIAEKYLLDTANGGQVLALLYEHKDATTISKAKILEIPESRFGMPEWREAHLRNGSSGWLAWASAVGMRKDTKQTRSYLMGYFSKASTINQLIAGAVNSA